MSDPTLFDFVDSLADAGQLHRVAHEIDPHYELAEVVRQLRAGREETPAVLCERVVAGAITVIASLYGSETALACAFGVDQFADLPNRIGQWLRPRGGRGVRDVLAMLPTLTKSLSWGDSGRQARCQQVVRLGRDVDLGQLPVPHCWPAESGASLTGGLLITRDADGEQTVETAVAEIVDDQAMRVRLDEQSPAFDAWSAARAEGRQLDVAYALGGPPALWPTVWLSEVLGIDATVLGEVLGRPQPETVRGRTIAATVPASAEIIIEGRIDPEAAPAIAGRLTTDWGRVSSGGNWATVSVHAITHAAAAVMPITVRHQPPHDVTVLDRLAEQCLEQLVCSLVPGVVSLSTPRWGAARQTVVLGIDAKRAARATEIAATVRGLHGLSKAKAVVLVDESVAIDGPEAVLTSLVESVAPNRDIRIVDTIPNFNDPSGAETGSAVIIDATSTVSSQPMRKARPSPAVAESVRKMLGDR